MFLVLCHLFVPVLLMVLLTFIYHPLYPIIKILLSDKLSWNAIKKSVSWCKWNNQSPAMVI